MDLLQATPEQMRNHQLAINATRYVPQQLDAILMRFQEQEKSRLSVQCRAMGACPGTGVALVSSGFPPCPAVQGIVAAPVVD